MFSNKRKTIGVYIFRTDQEYQNNVCRGISDQAIELGYNVAIFGAFGDYAHNKRFIEGEKDILDFANHEALAGVVLALDTFDVPSFEPLLMDKIKNNCNCPIVSVRNDVPEFNSVMINNDTAMEGVVRHFIVDHKFKEICFMSGPKTKSDANPRLNCFLRLMEEYKLSVSDQQIFYGDYWFHSAVDACNSFLKDDYHPQAIICANDCMALAVSNELIQRGYRIPENICVSGYDGLQEACTFYPSITTVRVPSYEMGRESVRLIDRHQGDFESCEKVIYEPELVLNESCGCSTTSVKNFTKIRSDYYEASRVDKDRNLRHTFMSIDMEEASDMDMLGATLLKHIGNLDGYESYYLCLKDGLEIIKGKLKWRQNGKMRLCFGMKERKYLKDANILFDHERLLPANATGESPQVFYFSPLHYQDHAFGYMALSFLETSNSGNISLPWIVNIENALENMLVQKEMERLISELENLYVRDGLTGLYNRRGFEKMANIYFQNAIETQTPMFVMGVDLDGMKEINDGYGHLEGDNALRVVAEALRAASFDNEICARMGGDEFSVACIGKTKRQVEEFRERFTGYLDRYNRTSGKPYQLYASLGIYCEVPTKNSTIEDAMNCSDKKMYKNKLMSKRKRGEI